MEGRPNIPVRRILRSPSLKRKSRLVPASEKVLLERVFGLTVSNGASLDTDPTTGTIAYPAGCVIVMYNSHKNKQSHICNQCKKTITCLAFSPDGKLLVTGESGHLPAVRVWDLEDNSSIAQFSGHQFGVNCVAFSPNLKYIVSVGTQHDMMVNVWNWKTNTKVASNKVASQVVGIAFSEDGSSFVTVGNRHVKFWYLDASKSRLKETVPLLGRSGILGDRKNNFFNGVCCGRGDTAGSTYCITQSGLLCEFNEKRLLSKWVELRTSCAYCLTVGEHYLYVGCAEGIVRIFNCRTLNYLSTLPRPHPLGVDVAAAVDSSQLGRQQESTACYPDTVAVSLDEDHHKLTCVYNDHSLYIWDVRDIHKIGKTRSFLYHSACIWSAEMYPSVEENAALPPGSFITCSSDDTIRVWNMDPHSASHTAFRRNVYSNELLKVIYTDPELNNIKNVKFNPAGKTDQTDTGFLDKNGVRAVRVCPTGQHMASGDRMGNIRIHDLHTMQQCHILEAHDSEVLCLEFTNPSTTGVHFLSSASRDRLIHVFDVGQQYGLVQTLDDHSSAITSVKFAEDGDKLHMISCGADKSLLFRTAQMTPHFQFVLNRHLVGKTTLYDMDVDATEKFVATACQDRNVRIYSIKNGKKKKCYSGSVGSEGTLIRVELDRSGAYLATTCSNKNICLYDFFSGELVASMNGHSEIVTGVKFMNDLKHLISVSGDGCIFVWRLPPEVTENMHSRMVELGKKATLDAPWQDHRSAPASDQMTDHKDGFSDVLGLLENNFPGDETPSVPEHEHEPDYKSNYRFSVGQLPSWAKKQVLQGSVRPHTEDEDVKTAAPRSRWAENPSLVMKTMVEENSPMKLSLSDTFNLQKSPEMASDMLQSLGRDTVPVVDDDDFNQDDSDDDEFRVLGIRKKDTSLQENPQAADRLSSLRSCQFGGRESTECEDRDEAADREVIYYPTPTDDLPSPASSSKFPVFEDSNKSKGRDDTGLEDMSEDDTDTPTTSTPSTPATEQMKPFPGDDSDMKFMQNNYESLTETEKFDTKLEDVMEDTGLTMFPTARLSFSRKFLSGAPSRYPLRSNHAHPPSSRQAKTFPPTAQTPVCTASGSDISSGADDKNTIPSVRHTDTQQKTANTLPRRTKWLPEQEDKLSTSSRDWKSMLDVADDGGSKQERVPRSRTPNPALARRSFSPSAGLYVVSDTHNPGPASQVCGPRPSLRASYLPQPAGGSSELKLPARHRSSKDEKTLAAPDRLTSTRTNGEKPAKTPGLRPHSYSMATASSKAKKLPRTNQTDKSDESGTLRSSGGNLSEARSRKWHPSRKGNLSAAQKAKFKSTPNLMELNDTEGDMAPLMSGSKTMEDLEIVDMTAKTSAVSRRELPVGKNRSRRSMPVTLGTKGLLTAIESQPAVNVNSPLNATFSIPSPVSPTAIRRPNSVVAGNDEADRKAMPPPVGHVTKSPVAGHVTVPSAAREQTSGTGGRKPEMSLTEAKDILLGRHRGPGAGRPVDSAVPLPEGGATQGSSPTPRDMGSAEVEQDNHMEPSPLDLPVKDSNVGQRDSMPRVSTEPVLGHTRTTWHSSSGSVRADARPRHRAGGAYRRSFSPSSITLARTLSPLTVVDIDSELAMSTHSPSHSESASQLNSHTDRPPSQPRVLPARQTPVIASQSDTAQPAGGSSEQVQLNEFFMSLLSRNSSSASDDSVSSSDGRPKPGHTAAARSLWERAIQQKELAQARRPGLRSKGGRVDANANCVQGEVDVVSEVTESETDRQGLTSAYITGCRSVVTPVLPSTNDRESAEESSTVMATVAVDVTETSLTESSSPPTVDLPVPDKSSSPPTGGVPVPKDSRSARSVELPVLNKLCSPPTVDLPVPDKSILPPTVDLQVPDKSSSPPTGRVPVPNESSSPPTELPVLNKSSSPPTVDAVAPDKSNSPRTADLPVPDKSKLPPSLDSSLPNKSSSPPIADLPSPDKSSSPLVLDLPVLPKSSLPPTEDLAVPDKFSSPPIADTPLAVKSELTPSVDTSVPDKSSPPSTADAVNNGSCTLPVSLPTVVTEVDKHEMSTSTPTDSGKIQTRANRSRLNLSLEGVPSVETTTDHVSAEQTCSCLDTAIQDTLAMYSQVCGEPDTGDKREVLRQTLLQTRQLIDDALADRVPPVTRVTDTDTDTDTGVNAGAAMLEHYSVQLADRVCALVQQRLLPRTSHDTKL